MTFGKRQPPGFRGINRRSDLTREPVDMPAEILIPGATPLECRIVDHSDTGARLVSILGVPEEFELRANGETGRVKVVRRGVRFLAVGFDLQRCAMPVTGQERRKIAQGSGAQNETLFTIYMVFLAIVVLLGVFLPRSAKAETLKLRLDRQAPPAVVADILIRASVDGAIRAARCLNARSDVLDPVRADQEEVIEQVRNITLRNRF